MNKKQFGFSLIELTVSVTVLGLVAVMVATIYPNITKDQRPYDVVNSFRQADEAIVGYVFAHGRLPCPANDTNGIESCALSQGVFPYRTLGMAQIPANAAGLDMRYSVFRRSNNDLRLDADLAVAADRYHPFWAQGLPPIAQPRALGQSNGLDFCHGLSIGGGTNFDANFLHVGSGAAAEHVAYLLLDPGLKDANGDGNSLDGVNGTGDLQFERPEAQPDRNNDDRIYVRNFAGLRAELGCSDVLLPTGMAHGNAVSTATIMQQSMADFRVQMALADDIAGADIALAVSGNIGALGGLAAALATVPIGISETIVSAGAFGGVIALAALGVAAETVAVAASVAGIVVAGLAKADTVATLNQVDGHIATLDALANQALVNAEAADSAGLYTR